MLALDVKTNAALVIRSIDKLSRKTFPKVTRNALDSTAFDVRKHIVEKVYPRSFTMRNKVFPRAAFRVEKATTSRPVSSVYDRFAKEWLRLQVLGGFKTPHTPGTLAVPTNNIRRTKRGKIPKSKHPRNLARSYRARFRNGKQGIYQRKGKKKSVLMYTLHKRTRVNAIFPFFKEAEKVATKEFPKHFVKKLRREIAKIRLN